MRHHSAETRRKMSAANTGRIVSEETRRKLSAANTGEKHPLYGKHHSAETRRKMSAANTGKPRSEETRRKISEANTGEKHPLFGKHHTEEARKKIGDGNTGKPRSEETRRKISEANTGKHLSEKTRRKLSAANTGRIVSAETRRKMSEAGYGGYWYGAVTYPAAYCDLFNEDFKERVRAFYGYACVECGTPQNGKKLAIHHVHYDKKTCCKAGEMVGDRQFVALCPSCHSKTNANRPYWEQHFTDMINNFYGGKSYFTKEEMAMVIRV